MPGVHMSWIVFREIIASAAPDHAEMIEREIRSRLGGLRISIPGVARAGPLTQDQIRAALAEHGWKVAEAAKVLGVHQTTLYRAMRPKRLHTLPDPIMGRFIR